MALKVQGQVAIITGASSGIGRASALQLAEAGFQVALGARNLDKLAGVAAEIKEATGHEPFLMQIDVRHHDQVKDFVAAVKHHFGRIDLLLNNAGLAKGTTPLVEETDVSNWDAMLDTNVRGLLLMTREAVPHMIEGGNGHVINLGSIAGREAYAGGGVYCASKFAVRAITEALRHELLGKPVRITTVDPGMVETDFSVVRLGDQEKADAVYAGMTPLTAEDIADCVTWAATRPKHVNIDAIIVKPLDQSGAGKVARR
ncbi:SDR family NAD(P)-dependent oxidoreductase [Tumebacillus sp. ITR2]|uniref:SDR family NAD(P)-dependent oxidoreductase n=1 Tax=Tumebacillus amylolyticus TaxID=2801339 RepID=A0ABS1J6R6_9BACL|nr:SDR family NAD(P)-dependent oxidoreductase [Tumebacillus amylolyticus]MBL0385971.1 SDR family NAD(P)-dependent oxidoreductase [Tumebacillus amylolyticus]